VSLRLPVAEALLAVLCRGSRSPPAPPGAAMYHDAQRAGWLQHLPEMLQRVSFPICVWERRNK